MGGWWGRVFVGGEERVVWEWWCGVVWCGGVGVGVGVCGVCGEERWVEVRVGV